jgi:hypothetical protein
LTDTQLYLAIGIPIVFNFGITLAFFVMINSNIATRFEAMEKLFTEKLFRVEQVMDARLKHLEEKQ